MKQRVFVGPLFVGLLVAFASTTSFAADEPAGLMIEPMPSLAAGLFAEFDQPCTQPASQTPRTNSNSWTLPKADPSTPMTRPEYPLESRQFLEMGTVLLKMYVNEQGKISQARVFRSSGWPRLDKAALQHSRLWQLVPGRENGKPACMWVHVPVIFDLRSNAYPSAQLEATDIKPEAEALSRQLLGFDAMNERLALRTMGAEGSREDVEARLFQALTDQEESRSVLRDFAAILTIEFSVAEMQELSSIWRLPAFRKFTAIQSKMAPDLRSRQQRLSLQGRCIAEQLKRSPPKDYAQMDSGGRASTEFLNAIPKVVNQLGEYCSCVGQQQQRGSTDKPTLATKCGVAPKIEW